LSSVATARELVGRHWSAPSASTHERAHIRATVAACSAEEGPIRSAAAAAAAAAAAHHGTHLVHADAHSHSKLPDIGFQQQSQQQPPSLKHQQPAEEGVALVGAPRRHHSTVPGPADCQTHPLLQ